MSVPNNPIESPHDVFDNKAESPIEYPVIHGEAFEIKNLQELAVDIYSLRKLDSMSYGVAVEGIIDSVYFNEEKFSEEEMYATFALTRTLGVMDNSDNTLLELSEKSKQWVNHLAGTKYEAPFRNLLKDVYTAVTSPEVSHH